MFLKKRTEISKKNFVIFLLFSENLLDLFLK